MAYFVNCVNSNHNGNRIFAMSFCVLIRLSIIKKYCNHHFFSKWHETSAKCNFTKCAKYRLAIYGACAGEVPGQLHPARPGQAQGRRQVQRRKGKNERTTQFLSHLWWQYWEKNMKLFNFFSASPFWKLYTPVNERILLECPSFRNTSVSSAVRE